MVVPADGLCSIIPRLPLRVVPHPDESLPSLLLRMAYRNLIPYSAHLLRAALIDHMSMDALVTTPAVYGQLALVFGLDEGALVAMSYAGNGRKRRILGHDVHHHLVSVRKRRVCPLCLADAAYHRVDWDVSLITVCSIHAVRLICECPACKRKLNWLTRAPEYCRCGQRLDRAPAEPVPAEELSGVVALSRLIRTPPEQLAGFPAEVGVDGILRLAFMLSRFELRTGRDWNPAKFPDVEAREGHLLVDVGSRAIANWPESFHGYLDRLRAARAGDRTKLKGKRFGFNKEFGFLLVPWLQRMSNEPFGRIALEGLRDYVAAAPDIMTTDRDIRLKREQATSPDVCISGKQAAGLLRITFAHFRQFAAKHGLLVSGGGTGAPLHIRAAKVKQLRHIMDGMLRLYPAVALLGLGKSSFVRLHRIGYLPAPQSGIVSELWPGPVWRASRLKAFLRKFERRVSSECVPVPQTVALGALGKGFAALGFGMEVVLDAVLDGRLVPVRTDTERRGLGRLAFRKTDAERFYFDMVLRTRHVIAVPEAAARLGIDAHVLYRWIRQGFLTASTIRIGVNCRPLCVQEDDLRVFQETFVTDGEVLKIWGSRFGVYPYRRLTQMGVKALTGPKVDRKSHYLYRRQDIEDALWSRGNGR